MEQRIELVKISVQGFDVDDVAAELQRATAGQGVDIQPLRGGEVFMDPLLGAALIAAGAAILAPVISGVFDLIVANRGKKMIIKGENWSVEVPVDTPKPQVDYAIQQAIQNKANTIIIIKDS